MGENLPADDLPPTLAEPVSTDQPTRDPNNSDPFATRPPAQTAPGSASPPYDFRAEGFELLAELGRGGMGVVYRARDLRRGQVVALKTMHGVDPAALLLFKHEFRGLAGVTHPNLIALYEMISDGAVWFFTMEYVEGMDFLSHLRPAGQQPPVWDAACHARFHGAFAQLAEGVQYLHDAGKLHRDLKPRNVLVTPAGRVVVLDFGLAAELDRTGVHASKDRHLLGTIPYMSPEQAAGQSLTPATDWYSVGVMLFEALTGRLPFASAGFQVLHDKQQHDAPAPRDLLATIPGEWNDLCVGLLERRASQRLPARSCCAAWAASGPRHRSRRRPPASLSSAEKRTCVPWRTPTKPYTRADLRPC